MTVIYDLIKFFNILVVHCLLLIVRAYQLIISPVLGPRCRFHPTCSHYCQEALVEHGFFKGLALTTKRILRCHPGHPGGYDPVPKKSQANHG